MAAGWIAAQVEMRTGSRAGRWYAKAFVIGVAAIIPAALVFACGAAAARLSARQHRARCGRSAAAAPTGRPWASSSRSAASWASILHGSGGLHILPPTAAMAMALVYLVATIASSIAFYPRMDQLDRGDDLWGGAAAASVVIILYPAWLFLWLGEWVREPMHEVLFGAMLAAWTVTYLIRKSRH